MLKRFGFREKKYYLCPSEEENARKHWGFSSFFCQNNGISTSEIGNFTSEIKFFSGQIGFFSGQVGKRINDIGY